MNNIPTQPLSRRQRARREALVGAAAGSFGGVLIWYLVGDGLYGTLALWMIVGAVVTGVIFHNNEYTSG